ncbi:MAG TPA: SUF system Fe-S cluster assembly regulator [Steroidobacter sp.]|jgi:FeS assembly SUF system regulator|nr:SUF system Fe-S cluster assembly regulator [Steroidobacteraceae bacterium]HLS81921.1 SUF system Fe-S cluster assembly regulator [Steroidobacter sp.]
MLRISKLTDYATVILACLASEPQRLWSASEVAERTRIGLPTVSKLLKKLQRSGLVSSARGSHGGYQLARPAADINAAHILDALEGPFAITECSGEHSTCGIEADCRVGHAWQRVNGAIRRALIDITLAQLAGMECGPTASIPASKVTWIARATHDPTHD